MFQEWQDERLTWDPADFGNLTDIIVRADKLWLPELAVMNGFVAVSFFRLTFSAPSCCQAWQNYSAYSTLLVSE